jgi:hypothetical protein
VTREEFDLFIESAYQRGLTHVLVGAERKPLPLSEWTPYGAFGSNPNMEQHIGGFQWLGKDQATDFPPNGAPVSKFDARGLWTFVRVIDENEDLLEEQERNYNRMIGESLRR